MQAPFRCRRAAELALVLVAVWCKKARPRSAPPIVISKAAWAIAMRTFIWVRPPSWRRVRWLDLSAHQKILLNDLQAPLFDVPNENRDWRDRFKLWKASRPACAAAFSSSIKTI